MGDCEAHPDVPELVDAAKEGAAWAAGFDPHTLELRDAGAAAEKPPQGEQGASKGSAVVRCCAKGCVETAEKMFRARGGVRLCNKHRHSPGFLLAGSASGAGDGYVRYCSYCKRLQPIEQFDGSTRVCAVKQELRVTAQQARRQARRNEEYARRVQEAALAAARASASLTSSRAPSDSESPPAAPSLSLPAGMASDDRTTTWASRRRGTRRRCRR